MKKRIAFSLGSILTVNQVLSCTQYIAKKKYGPDTIWIPETWGMENFSMLGSISQNITTHKSKIGSSIINVYSRSPSLISMGAVTVDTLSKGRLILGLGTSSIPIIRDFHGQDFDKPLTRMREYIQVIRMITSGKKIEFNGRFFKLKGFQLLIKPFRETIPIYVAAVNQKMVELAWDISDGVIFYLRPLSEMRDTITNIQSKKNIDVTCQIITAISKNDSQKAIERAKTTLSFYIAVGKIYREFLANNGFRQETTNIYQEYKETRSTNSCKDLVTERMLRALTICGEPDECRKKLEQFYDAGVTLPIIQFNPVVGNNNDPLESFNESFNTFSDVMTVEKRDRI